MRPPVRVTIDNENFVRGFQDASGEISRITQEEIVPAAGLIEDAFSTAANSIQRSLGRAVRTGSLSLQGLARSLANDLGRVAIDRLVRRPIDNLLTNLFTAPFGGARANGGFVAPGSQFLVGERGPEMFVPQTTGRIVPASRGGAMSVNINLPGVRDVAGFQQSQTQIAASLARIISHGQRNQ